MFQTWSENQDSKYQKFLESFEAFKVQNEQMKHGMSVISMQYDEIKSKIDQLEQEKKI